MSFEHARHRTAADSGAVGLSGIDRDGLTALRIDLLALGYFPVPIIGPTVNVPSAGKRPAIHNWINRCKNASETDVQKWSIDHPTATNTGLLCGNVVAVDIDVRDQTVVQNIEDVAREILGASPLRRIGAAPKSLLVYATTAPFAKQATRRISLAGADAQVEILAEGQQFVAFGKHPLTKSAYQWTNLNPIELRWDELPFVDEDACRAFLSETERLLLPNGFQNKKLEKKPGGSFHYSATLDREDIESALACIPNDDESYDGWIKVGLALYSALGHSGQQIWQNWSALSAKDMPTLTSQKWQSFKSVNRVGAGTIFWLAKKNGWTRRGNGAVLSRASVTPKPRQIETIEFVQGELSKVVDRAESALIAADLGVYQRGGLIVTTGLAPVLAQPDGAGNKRLFAVDHHRLTELLTSSARWKVFDQRSSEYVIRNCPTVVAQTLLSRVGSWNLQVLTSVINAPTLRPDGSVLDDPGYDAKTGLLYDPGKEIFPLIPAHPGREEALAALESIGGLIASFPFVRPEHRAVAISAILTASVRSCLRSMPLHAFSAPTAGSGKGLLVDVASTIATGRQVAVLAQGDSEEEFEKRIGSALLEGDDLVSIDNCEQPLGGDFLCQVLTQPVVKVRILGKSKNVEVPANAAIFATGNNLTVVGDMTRRCLKCELDPQVERPELREFGVDPVQQAREGRPRYLVAAITMMRAYIVAGRPKQAPPIGSFVEWSDLVRNTLLWLGEADPCATMSSFRQSDPKLSALTAVLEQWSVVIGLDRVSAKDVVHASQAQSDDDAANFRDALNAVAGGSGDQVSTKRLGKYLALNQGRIVEGRKIVDDGLNGGIRQWRLVEIRSS